MKLLAISLGFVFALFPAALKAAAITDLANNPIATGTATDRVPFTNNSTGIYETFIFSVPAPVITNITSSTPNGAYRAAQSVSIQITLNANVIVTGIPTLALNTGGSASYSSGSGTGTLTFNYAIGASQTAADLDYSATNSLSLAGGGINAANGGTAATLTLPTPGSAGSLGANKAIVIDTTAPTIGISAPSASSIVAGAGSVTYTVTYSDTNLISSTLSPGNITLNTSGTANGTVGVINNGSNCTVTISSITGSGSLGISITSGTAIDTASNTAPSAGPSSTFSVLSAPSAPTIGTATRGNASASVTFTAPANTGGSAIISYTVTSNPSGITATGSGSPINVTGLTNGTAYTFTVTATNGVGTGAPSAASNSVTPLAPPALTNISPTSGRTIGGTVVTITGTSFSGATAVTFGGNAATIFTVNSATQITATTPAGTVGTASVLVTTPGGTNSANSLFTYTSLTDIEKWRQIHFSSIANSGDGANTNDFDNDGVANLLEFAFGLNPKSGSSLQTPQALFSGSDLVMSFTQPVGVSGITYKAEWSTTLLTGSWTPITDNISGSVHSFRVPRGTHQKMFMRLNVTEP